MLSKCIKKFIRCSYSVCSANIFVNLFKWISSAFCVYSYLFVIIYSSFSVLKNFFSILSYTLLFLNMRISLFLPLRKAISLFNSQATGAIFTFASINLVTSEHRLGAAFDSNRLEVRKFCFTLLPLLQSWRLQQEKKEKYKTFHHFAGNGSLRSNDIEREIRYGIWNKRINQRCLFTHCIGRISVIRQACHVHFFFLYFSNVVNCFLSFMLFALRKHYHV